MDHRSEYRIICHLSFSCLQKLRSCEWYVQHITSYHKCQSSDCMYVCVVFGPPYHVNNCASGTNSESHQAVPKADWPMQPAQYFSRLDVISLLVAPLSPSSEAPTSCIISELAPSSHWVPSPGFENIWIWNSFSLQCSAPGPCISRYRHGQSNAVTKHIY